MRTAERETSAFDGDARTARILSTAKALWWAGNQAVGRALVRPEASEPALPEDEARVQPPPPGLVRQAWLAAFRKDAADIAAGLYPFPEDGPVNPVAALRRAADLMADAREVEARRRRGGGTESRDETPSGAYPNYYRQNFHFQSGGWFTPESAGRYEAQVELLFAGAAGPMRRRTLSLLARAWRGADQRGLTLIDLACGSGAFLRDLGAAFPKSRLMGVDLSHPYAAAARVRSGRPVLQASAERLPFADASVDALSCVYLFHELPPRVRVVVAGEIGRVLKPGGVFAFADSVQTSDQPEFSRMLHAFPKLFHEPYFQSYQATGLPDLFKTPGLSLESQDSAFLTKALLFRKG